MNTPAQTPENKPDAQAFKSRGGIARIARAAKYSLDGFAAAFRNEAAFRQLLLLNLVLIPIAVFLPVTRAERVLLIVTPLLSLVVELFNSAIEATVDRISLEIHPLSKQAKDLGSAAQMLALVITAVTWGIILL